MLEMSWAVEDSFKWMATNDFRDALARPSFPDASALFDVKIKSFGMRTNGQDERDVELYARAIPVIVVGGRSIGWSGRRACSMRAVVGSRGSALGWGW